MHNGAIKNFAKIIANICTNITDPMAEFDRKRKCIKKKEIASSLVDDNLDNYENKLLLKLLKSETWEKKYSEKYLDDKLRTLLSNILSLKNGNNEEDLYALSLSHFEKLVEEYESFTIPFLVYVPLVGIKMKIESLELGKVVLRNMTESFIKTLDQKLEDEEKNNLDFLKYCRDTLSELKNTVCAESEVVAEPIKAKEIAEKRTLSVIHLLRYSIPTIYNEKKISIGLQGEIGETRLTPIIAKDGSKFKFNLELASFKRYFEISKDTKDNFKKIGVFELSKLLKKTELTDYEDVLIRGVHWFADSINQNETVNKYLSLIVCLETFLSPNKTAPISNSLAEGIALLLYEGFGKRKKIKSRVKELYDLRSKVFHGGCTKSIKEEDYNDLRSLLQNLIIFLIGKKEKLKTKKELLELIEQKKLSN